MEYSKTQDKSLTDKTPKTRNREPSITNASFLPEAVNKYVSGVRKPIGVRVDTRLYSRFKPLSKRIFGSTCNAIEIYMATLILTAESPASICNTSGRRINIEKIVIERRLRERRNLEIVEDSFEKCLFCHKVAVDRLRCLKDGRVYPVCGFHFQELLSSGNWSVLENE